jgi:predicted site-specific integrase-resolvase
LRRPIRALAISRRTLYRRIESGEIPQPHYWHGKPYFRADELRAIVDRLSGPETASGAFPAK